MADGCGHRREAPIDGEPRVEDYAQPTASGHSCVSQPIPESGWSREVEGNANRHDDSRGGRHELRSLSAVRDATRSGSSNRSGTVLIAAPTPMRSPASTARLDSPRRSQTIRATTPGRIRDGVDLTVITRDRDEDGPEHHQRKTGETGLLGRPAPAEEAVDERGHRKIGEDRQDLDDTVEREAGQAGQLQRRYELGKISRRVGPVDAVDVPGVAMQRVVESPSSGPPRR